MSDETARADGLRDLAIKRLKKRRDLMAHLLVYVLVNSLLVTIWALTGRPFFWPAIVMGGWGIGVVMNVWDVYFGDDFSEEQIEREMEHLEQRR